MNPTETTDRTAVEATADSRKRRALASLATIAALAGAGGAWAGIAGAAAAVAAPLTAQQSSVTMIIVNHSNVAEQLVSSDPEGGWWITGPKQTLLAGESETVVAATNSPEQHVQLNYVAQNPQQSHITYGLHNCAHGTDMFNTGVTDGAFGIRTDVAIGYPDAVARYNLR